MIKVHLGAGKRNWPDWINIDKADFPHIHYRDITRLPFRNNEVSICYASHLLAYFDRQEIVPILNEWKRVLKPGGILRLATPDFDAIGNLIVLNKYPLEAFLGPLYGKMVMGDKTIYHKTVYNFESLKYLLEEVGFKNVHKYNWWEEDTNYNDDHSKSYFPHSEEAIKTGDFSGRTLISLNIECTK